ncbi:hypothetical protein ATZ33_02900 [Enterococcus silesiacus]|uniref:DUF218 domain-containing protein n=1 Tax=Enterococcus silesiacus TaxID=332949 RepID=A0A0S3K7U8_9ENTE|nr:YdcF family protein [Enterococcus silesiacus]ALS00362.1 hypothetical protein ATZ33_02900 [Enterococcus silesiacus]OJG93355.1 hypothetical protein RV15_GL001387 [Enterococcus silesiacus]
MIQDWNTVIEFLAAKEQIDGTYDLAILAGNSLPYLADELIRLYEQGVVSQFMLVGGIGHATVFLQRNFKKMGVDVHYKSETDMYLDYFKLKYGLDKERFITENTSTNSGENARFSLKVVEAAGLAPKKVLLLEDPILQRRIKATFEKEWQETDTVFTNYVPRIPFVKAVGESVLFENSQLNGLWDKEYFLSLVLGEIPRLRDDKNGYGPNGSNYIGTVNIPESVEQSYEKLSQLYEYQQKR